MISDQGTNEQTKWRFIALARAGWLLFVRSRRAYFYHSHWTRDVTGTPALCVSFKSRHVHCLLFSTGVVAYHSLCVRRFYFSQIIITVEEISCAFLSPTIRRQFSTNTCVVRCTTISGATNVKWFETFFCKICRRKKRAVTWTRLRDF